MKKIPHLIFALLFLAGFVTQVQAQSASPASGSGQDNKRQLVRTLQGVVSLKNGWKLKTEQGYVWIKPYDKRIVELSFSEQDLEKGDSSHAVIMKPEVVVMKTEKVANGYRLIAGDLQIFARNKPFQLSYIFKKDTILAEESGFFTGSEGNGVRFKLSKDEKIYGLGERSTPLDRRSYRLPLYNQPNYGYEVGATSLNYSVPMVLSSKKYALLYDNPQKGYADIGKEDKDVMEWNTIGGTARYFMMAAADFPELMKQYTRLTGRQDLPPRWAFGNLMSRMAYRNQKEADSIVSLMQKKNFPIDAIILDFYWFGDSILGHLGTLDWYKPAWPDPEGMIRKFKGQGVKTILITEPYVIDSMANFKVGVEKGIFATDSLGKTYVNHKFYFGPGGLIDIFKPVAKEWFWEKYKKQIDIGVAAWWGDLGEPESHQPDMYHVTGKADEVHNIYGHYWDRMLYEKYAQFYPNTRLFHLQRSGFAGSQRYSAFPWTGDVSRSWGGLQAQLPILLSMGMNGLGYIHSDAGGFAIGLKDEELYTRWLQFSTFTPILRPHGSNVPSEPVFYTEKTQDIVRKYMQLRYAMLPYNYSLAWENASTGAPLMRPMFYYGKDSTSAKIQDQYFWGENILVAPILEKGIQSRKLWLPAGDWYEFGSGERMESGKWLDYKVVPEEIPLFVKAGAFIPMTEPLSTTDKYTSDNFTVYYYPSKSSSFTQFEDDGKDKLSISGKQYELIRYTGRTGGGKTLIDISKTGTWPGMPESRSMKLKVLLKGPFVAIRLNGNSLHKITKEGPQGFLVKGNYVEIRFQWKGQPIKIEILDK